MNIIIFSKSDSFSLIYSANSYLASIVLWSAIVTNKMCNNFLSTGNKYPNIINSLISRWIIVVVRPKFIDSDIH